MKKLFPLVILVFLGMGTAIAAPGDTTVVSSLDDAQLTWWGKKTAWGEFPDASSEYRKIVMEVTLGCATGGCSDWDYTVRIEATHQTGVIDSVLTPYSSFTVNGVAIDTYYFSLDTTYVTSYNVLSGMVDSNATSVKTVLIYGDTNNYLVPTDTFYVWDANITNSLYDGSGNVIGDSIVPSDSILYATYVQRYKLFEVENEYELGRFMTPYGGYMAGNQHGFDNSWQHTYQYDVTDFAAVLQDSVEIGAFYGGWSSGFSVDVNFVMIEGTPAREVLSLENVYRSGPGGWRSDDPAAFETNYTPAKTLDIDASMSTAKMRITPSGHGFVNSQNCAEFCNREYRLKVDNTIRYTQDMWRDDCGSNAIFPQGGTWLYDRANWCPGDKTHTYHNEIGTYLTAGSSNSIDLDLEMYAIVVAAGEVPPNYIIDAVLFQYDQANFALDAEVIDIISPSQKDAHGRQNPICGKPVIEIRNGGSTTLTSVDVIYGVVGATPDTVTWTGSLDLLESEIVELESISDWDGTSTNFEVTLSNPNNGTDEYADNNSMASSFDTVPVYSTYLILEVGTNNRAAENNWKIYDNAGDIVALNDLAFGNTFHSDTINLQEGCFEFVLTDTDRDGLSWWANSDETNGGPVWIKNSKDPAEIYQSFQTDFGTEIRHQFMTKNTFNSGVKGVQKGKLSVVPNPSSGQFTISASNVSMFKNTKVMVTTIQGELIYEDVVSNIRQMDLDLSTFPAGSYVLMLQSEDRVFNNELLIIR